ncbi:MAG: hypothetical protein AAFZ15_30620 [Bacteroidota bacterium]
MLSNATARTLSLDKVLYHEGLSFGVIRHSRQVQLPFVQSVDAVIIQTASNREFGEICVELRNQPEPEDYLKPVFMVANPSLKPSWNNEVDGITELENLIGISERTRRIHKLISKIALVKNPPQTFEVEVLIKLMQYLFTREKELIPFPNRYSKIHFNFPFVSNFFDETTEHRVLHAIKLAERKGWITGKVIEKLHLCPNCGSNHQTLRATCKKCGSVDLLEEDLVHHFPCAYIGPISDFETKDGNGLHCPKCDKSLRHIGNDYDKPSSIYNCNSCHHTFQQSDFKSLCVDCGANNDIHALEEWDIRQLQISPKGKSIILNGTGLGKAVEPQPKKSAISGIYDFEVFKILLKQELAQRKINPRPGVLGQVKIEGIIVDRIPLKTRQELATEVCQVIRSYLKGADVVSAKGPGAYYFMMTDSGINEAMYLNELLTYNLGQLIGSNFTDQKIAVKVKLEPMVK